MNQKLVLVRDLFVKALENLNKLERITYTNYFFTYSHIKKRIQWIEDKGLLDKTKLPAMNKPARYIKWGD